MTDRHRAVCRYIPGHSREVAFDGNLARSKDGGYCSPREFSRSGAPIIRVRGGGPMGVEVSVHLAEGSTPMFWLDITSDEAVAFGNAVIKLVKK